MDAVRSFFKKYNAVPADDSGPRYDLGPVEPVVAQFHQLNATYKDARLQSIIRNKGARTPELVAMRRDLTAMAKALLKRPGFGGVDEGMLKVMVEDFYKFGEPEESP